MVEVEVTNAGEAAGEEVVQLYVGYPGSRIDRPVKELKGFRKIALAPGRTETVRFEVKAEDLAYYDPVLGDWQVEESDYAIYVGPNSRGEDLLRADFCVNGD